MIKVKDAKKLQETLEQAIKALGKVAASEVQIKKRTYKGAEVREIHVKQPGFIFVPTYTIHNNWLVVSLYPAGDSRLSQPGIGRDGGVEAVAAR